MGRPKMRTHGKGKRRTWRKLHVAMNPSDGPAMNIIPTKATVHDDQMVASLLRGRTRVGARIKSLVMSILKSKNRPSGGMCCAHLPEGANPRVKGLSCPHKAEPHVVELVARVEVAAIRGTQALCVVAPTTATNNAERPG